MAAESSELVVSRGMLQSLSGISRILFFASTALLIPAILGLHVPVVAAALETRALRLADLRVEVSEVEARETWEKAQAMPLQDDPDESQVDDEQALDNLSRHFEEGLAARVSAILSPSRTVSLRTQAVRERILEQVAHASGGRLETAPVLAAVENIDPVSKEAIASYEATFDTPSPRTEAGRQFRKRLDKIRHDNLPVWVKFQQAAKQSLGSFQRTSTTDDLGSFILNQILGAGIDPDPSNSAFDELIKKAHEGRIS